MFSGPPYIVLSSRSVEARVNVEHGEWPYGAMGEIWPWWSTKFETKCILCPYELICQISTTGPQNGSQNRAGKVEFDPYLKQDCDSQVFKDPGRRCLASG